LRLIRASSLEVTICFRLQRDADQSEMERGISRFLLLAAGEGESQSAGRFISHTQQIGLRAGEWRLL
jgi:hypothetical protein